MTPLDKIKNCIETKKNFVLQGGAGSGKTETLKQVLEFISHNHPEAKIACITHTNLAVDEIKSRVESDYTISTIHSLLNSVIKDYKRNIHQVIYEIFKLDRVERLPLSSYGGETEQKKSEHEKYKKTYEKYSTRLSAFNNGRVSKVEGKREYDVNPETFNGALNIKIDSLNKLILQDIESRDFNTTKFNDTLFYNETRFDNFKELSFGHDSLLEISYLLFDKFPKLGKIIRDKFDYVFIDEYQDTNPKIVEIFLKKVPNDGKTTIGLFGDSMQAIYEDGIGDVNKYVSDGDLQKIIKEDNYRCSEQVVKFINQIRNDGLEQKVAFKKVNGKEEVISDRQGVVKLYYGICKTRPNTYSPASEKEAYVASLNEIIKKAQFELKNSKSLMLTNKSISTEVNFKNLYDVYSSRFTEVHEKIEKDLIKLQLFDLAELCDAYTNKGNNNFILTELKKSGYPFKSIDDKIKVKEFFDLIISSGKNAVEIIEIAFEKKILKKGDSYSNFIIKKDIFLKDLTTNTEFQKFKSHYISGLNTFIRISPILTTISEDEFKEFEKLVKKETFYKELFSNKVKFIEVLNYFKYMNEETSFITMHKTKGSGIDNVLVVLDEYFWNKYNFKSIFDSTELDIKKKLKNQKLFYVACSRAKTNLSCVRLILADEEKEIKKYFENCIEIKP